MGAGLTFLGLCRYFLPVGLADIVLVHTMCSKYFVATAGNHYAVGVRYLFLWELPPPINTLSNARITVNELSYIGSLAGLLHDIGKFMLRAAEGGTRIWDAEARRDFRYKHAMLTASFVEQYVPEPWRQPVMLAAGNHHNPQRRLDWAVALADRLSAGERDTGDDERVQATHPKQLLSVFALLRADGLALTPEKRAHAYLPLVPLAMQKDHLFPGPALADEEAVWQRYRKMWDEFALKAGQLRDVYRDGDLPAFVESVLLLMQQYTWSIPSAYYQALPDISLYDHSRTTAALAAILADGPLTEEDLRALARDPRSERPLALLVGGDLSGIQDFIYTISSRGAISALRGRSFYLQLLMEAIARFVLGRLNLPITNIIYSGGGSFYILARPEDTQHLAAIRGEISRSLLRHHRGDLYVALEGEPLRGVDFFQGRIGQAWDRLHARLQRAKARRFSELSPPDLQWLFVPHGHGGNEDLQCQVCGLEHPNTHVQKDEVGNEVRKCPPCLSYEALGKQLRQARFLVLEETASTPVRLDEPPGGWEEILAAFGLRARLTRTFPASSDAHVQRRVVLALHDEAQDALHPDSRTAVGRRLLVNVTPTITAEEIEEARKAGLPELPAPGSVKPFHVMAWQSRGISRVGVLRMDVDNLGRIFAEGLGERATLSRVAALSFAMSVFFEGWVERLAEEQNRRDGRGERLYSIYSGGDDLFFVGSWDAVVELARHIRADLGRYAAHHPGIHASAGMVLIRGKYPLAQAARDAGEAEEAAKRYRRPNGGSKDAVCFLGEVQPWEMFGLEEDCFAGLGSVHQMAHLFAEMVQAKGAPRRLLRVFLSLYDQYKEREKELRERGTDVTRDDTPQTIWGPWIPRGYYVLKRMAKQSANEDIDRLADTLQKAGFSNLSQAGLAARWAELLSRSREAGE